MSLESDLVEFYLSHGASLGLAARLAVEQAAEACADMADEKLDQDIGDLFHTMPRPELARKLRVHRSTIYRRKQKLSHAPVAVATTTEYLEHPGEA